MKHLILHGTFGSPEKNWFPWLKTELTKLGEGVLAPQLPVDDYDDAEAKLNNREEFIPQNQTLENWLKFWDENISEWYEPENTVVIAHSIAPVFLLHLIEKRGVQFDCGVFVAPFYNKLGLSGPYEIVNDSFHYSDFDFQKINELLPISYAIFSDNDPYVPIEESFNFVEQVGSVPIMLKGGEHLGGVLKEFPLVLELCKGRIGYLR